MSLKEKQFNNAISYQKSLMIAISREQMGREDREAGLKEDIAIQHEKQYVVSKYL